MSELLIASDPQELLQSQHKLIDEVGRKIELAKHEAKSSHDMMIQMREARLNVHEAKRLHTRATSRVTYLIKIKSALEAGYLMMPDMEGDIIAVRSNRSGPSPVARRAYKSSWKTTSVRSVPDEQSSFLPPGEGRYISPRQGISTTSREIVDGSNKKTEYSTRAISLRNPDGLNIQFIRPEVISRTAGAMTHRIFDEIVTVRPVSSIRRRSRDPIVLGRIIDKATRRCCAFMIAWFVDPVTDI